MKERHFRTIIANFVIITVLGLTLAATIIAARPNSVNVVESVAIYSGNKNGKSVSLMVNVYEGTAEVVKIAEILNARGFSTTFFVGGKWLERNGDTLLRLAAMGFEIGNHGYLHRDHAKLTKQQNRDEIVLTEKLIATHLADLDNNGQDGIVPMPKLFAPPSGSIGTAMFETCEALGYDVIMWTRDTIDWRDHDANIIFERAVKNIKAGDLILMHPTACTVEALPKILDYITNANLKVDTVTNTLK